VAAVEVRGEVELVVRREELGDERLEEDLVEEDVRSLGQRDESRAARRVSADRDRQVIGIEAIGDARHGRMYDPDSSDLHVVVLVDVERDGARDELLGYLVLGHL